MISELLDDAQRNEADGREGGDDADTLRDRYQELIDELRVILPGVQVLFAFLITAPFSGRFGDLTDAQRVLYAVSLVTSTLALIVLLTPVAYHRLSDPSNRAARISVAIRFKMAGLALLGCSMVTALAAVVSFAFSPVFGVAIAIGAATVSAVSWLAFPLSQRRDATG